MALALVQFNDGPVAVGNTATTIYANPANKQTKVHYAYLHNYSGSAVDVTLYFVPDSGGSVGSTGTASQVYKVSLDPNETVEVPLNVLLEDTNDSIRAVASAASSVNGWIDGVQNSTA